MSAPGTERLYRLIPAHYRSLDAARGEPLRALMAVLEEQLQALEGDLERLYRNSFIETCEDRVVPYLADLLAVRMLNEIDGAAYNFRSYVGNVLSYRRRKGTLSLIPELGIQVTGWSMMVLEAYRQVAMTRQINLPRAQSENTDLRHTSSLSALGSPFCVVPHNVDVRRPYGAQGRHNLPNIGIYVWRVEPRPVVGTPAAKYLPETKLYHFDPLGRPLALFNSSRLTPAMSATDVARLPTEHLHPVPLRRRALYDDLERYRGAVLAGQSPTSDYFGDKPAFTISFKPTGGGPLEVIEPQEIDIADLSGWTGPDGLPGTHDYGSFERRVIVDPELGRLAIVDASTPEAVYVGFHHGTPAKLGGGTYDRTATFASPGTGNPLEVRLDDPDRDTLAEAAAAWAATGQSGVIQIQESEVYALTQSGQPDHPNLEITVPAGVHLEIRASHPHRPILRPPAGTAAVDLMIKLNHGSTFSLNGVILDRVTLKLKYVSSTLDDATVHLKHCTFVPWSVSGETVTARTKCIELEASTVGARTIRIHMQRCISGPILITPQTSTLVVEESIVEFDTGRTLTTHAIATAGGVTVLGSTILGKTSSWVMDLAEDSIFTAPVTVTRLQNGQVRHCYIPDGSVVPRPAKCQPVFPVDASSVEREAVMRQVHPRFYTREIDGELTRVPFGWHDYGRLTGQTPPEIRGGVQDGGEMGAFHHLQERQREANLSAIVEEYLRFGLEAGIHYLT